MAVFVLGSREVVAALALAGLPGRTVNDREGVLEALNDPEGGAGAQLLVIEEATAETAREEIDRLKLEVRGPLVVEVPGFAGPLPGRRTPLEMVKQALGLPL
jgi:vacuolar-type H+-ATPase subunit F/Vma7